MTPDGVRGILASDTADVWVAIAPLLPRGLYLAGGTALAVHLGHRATRGLDLFYHGDAIDLDALEGFLACNVRWARTTRAPGTLNGLVSATRVQFLHADEGRPQLPLDLPGVVAGLCVAAVRELLAMTLKAIGDGGELRDYFDIMAIEQSGRFDAAEGLSFLVERFRPTDTAAAVRRAFSALGYLEDRR